MTDIASDLKKIQVEETKFKASVSEATMTKLGGSINSIVDNYEKLPEIIWTTEATASDGTSAVRTVVFVAPYDCVLGAVSIFGRVRSSSNGVGSFTLNISSPSGVAFITPPSRSVTANQEVSVSALIISPTAQYYSGAYSENFTVAGVLTSDFAIKAGEKVTISYDFTVGSVGSIAFGEGQVNFMLKRVIS